MKTKFSTEVIRDLVTIKKKNAKLAQRIRKQLSLFEENPKHPSLRIHKLSGNLENHWSISITRSYRMVYFQEKEDIAYFIMIGTHDEVYKK